MSDFVHLRHKPACELSSACDLVLACPPMRSNVNLSRIVRLAGCCGVRRMIVCGRPKVDRKIARDAADRVSIEAHRSLPPVLQRLRAAGYQLVGLEQATHSESLYTFRFCPQTVLVIGNERQGLDAETLGLLDRVVEIPVFGMPHSYNVATAAAMTLYEYCRQFAVS